MTGKGRFIGVAFLICALLFLNGCNGTGTTLKTRAGAADEIGQTPAETEKAKLLKQLDRRFENPKAHYQLGQLYQADGLWTQAEYRYKAALSFEPAYRDAQAARIKVLQAADDTRVALLLADEYINQASVSAEQSLLLALAFQKEGLDDYALGCYQQALRLAPNSAKINRQIGYYYLSKNNRVQAVDYLTRSFQLDSNQPEVAGELGRLGVAVRIPRKTGADTRKLDRIVEQSTK